MPNLPVAIRRGVIALYSEDADDALKQQLGDLFVALGLGMWAADEAKFAAIGSVAGAGPAYVARFIAALAKAGEKRGLSQEIASTIALETVLGTAWMAASAGETMDSIARRVASPKGTTEAGLAVLDRDGVLDELVARDDRGGRQPRRGARRRGQRRACLPKSRACPRRDQWQGNRRRLSTIATAGSGSTASWSRGATPKFMC